MGRIRKHFKTILAAISCTALLLSGCSAPAGQAKKASIEEELLANVPKMDPSLYNRFLFTMDITAYNAEGEGKEFTEKGAVELYRDISHMYDLDVYFAKSGYRANPETWADFRTGERYTNLGEGFYIDTIANSHAIGDLVDAINNRGSGLEATDTDTACSLSWTFPTDSRYVFGAILEHYTTDMDLDGYGRATAVFDPQTHEFCYFTFVISAKNAGRAGAMLDAAFYWSAVNSRDAALEIPGEISRSAYKTSTGISTDGGYDEVVNPMAEGFMGAYGGTAEVAHDQDGAYMFWTKEGDSISVTVNYVRTDRLEARYKENRSFLESFYGKPAEEAEDCAYFYGRDKGELAFMAKGDGWYAEITVTGDPGMTQGELRKTLITYKSKLGI